ncbi:MAG: tetratricopeptide repeat protein [Deltaproteobacteria bacterium]|nr:tetratricopeptide repeat protein [Deltaproteobacteria bacterium]
MVLFWCLFALLTGDPSGVKTPDPNAGRDLYYQALQAARAGDSQKAVDILKHLRAVHPRDSFADDALLEQARLAEESLSEPANALSLYRRLIQQYPNSRSVRRAKARVDFLSRHLGQGEQVLSAYQKIQHQSVSIPPAESAEKMLGLLENHKDFSLRPDGLYWVGSLWIRAEKYDRARKILWAVVADYPEHRAAGLALLELGNLEIKLGNLGAAEKVYSALASLPKKEWQKSSAGGQRRVDSIRFRNRVIFWAWVFWGLVAFCLWLSVVIGVTRKKIKPSQLIRLPIEALAYLLVMVVLIIWASSGACQTTHALIWLTGMVFLLLVPNGWLLRKLTLSVPKLMCWMLVLLLAGGACIVAAIGAADMATQVLHTIKFGPGG